MSNENEEYDYEPQVTSNDPEERKLARRLRIKRRLEALQKAACPEVITVEEQEQKNAVLLQVRRSTELMEKFVNEAEEYITNVRVANDAREVDRREAEGASREKVFKELEEEAESERLKFEEIAVKWSVIQKYNDPLHINEDIANQKEKCELLIKQKDSIILMLKEELKRSEKKFSDDQKKQCEDINALYQRIEKHVCFIRRAYQQELAVIEEVIMSERLNLVESNNKRWEELFKQQKEQEMNNSTKKFEQIEEYQTKMNELRQDFYEKFRATKIHLEKDIEELQKELERIKALALLNSEKLDYNYQILKKREDENLIIKSQQKRRLNKLHDVINDLKKKISDYETTTKNQIKKLKENIKSTQKNIIDVELKADHFAKVNDERFHQIWDLNKSICDNLLQKILFTDKILYEQHMGVPWNPPPISNLPKSALPSYKTAVVILTPHKVEKSNKSIMEFDKEKATHDINELDSNSIYRRLLNFILKRISDKSGFLTEKKLKELLKPYEEGERCLVKLEQIFHSLKITNKKYIDILINYFLPYTYCPICSKSDAETCPSIASRYTSQLSNISSIYSRMDQHHIDIEELDEAMRAIQQPEQIINDIVVEIVSSDTYLEEDDEEHEAIDDITCGNILTNSIYSDLKDKKISKKKTAYAIPEKVICQYSHPLFMSSIYVLMGLRDFVMAYYEEKERFPTTRERLTRKRQTISRLLVDEEIVQFWEKYKTTYDEDRIRVWDALLEGFKIYHELLKDRKCLSEEVVSLRKQNHDLKKILANYSENRILMEPSCALDKNALTFKRKYQTKPKK